MKVSELLESNVTQLKKVWAIGDDGKLSPKMVDMSKLTPITGKEERAMWVGQLGAELEEAGIHFAEKPDGWEYLDDHKVITPSKMRKLEDKLKEIDHPMQRVAGETLYGGKKPNHPLDDVNTAKLPKDKVFIVQFVKDGSKYLVNNVGASTYIRMWAKIDV